MSFSVKKTAWRLIILTLVFGIGVAFRGRIYAQTERDDTRLVRLTRGNRQFHSRVLRELPDPDKGRPARAGSILVTFRDIAAPSLISDLTRNTGTLVSERLFLPRTYRLQVPEPSVAQVLRTIRNHPLVEYAVSDLIMYAATIPNDPLFSSQWGQTKIRTPDAWNVTTSDSAVRIAILDCGIYDSASTYVSPDGSAGHPDIRNKVVSRINFTTAPDADDFCNHGTHVAGIAAASTNNAIGVSGTGHDANIVNVKVLGDNGSGSFSWIINGILWAAGCDTTPCGQRRADVINMSLGATGSCDPLVQSAIDQAWAQGLVIVAAAGNNNASGAITPANCNHVIGVSASDQNDEKASFSNYGAGVDVAAPGIGILSTDYIGGYASMSGTSMATPHVSGLAALLWTTPYNAGNGNIVHRIFQTAQAGTPAGSAYGRIDAYASVTDAILPTPTPSPAPTPTPTPTPTPAPLACKAPVILTHSDTNPTRGGTVSFSWNAVPGATSYRVQRHMSGSWWSTRKTTTATSFTGSDSSSDPTWRIFVSTGTCAPLPGPATVFDP